jgi:hypothetical protein
MTSLQQQRLLKSAVPQFCPFVDVNAFNQVEDLLPTNPRKLKNVGSQSSRTKVRSFTTRFR